MKKTILFISIILLVIIILCIMRISGNSKKVQIIKAQNQQYEQYLKKEIYGTDVMSLINKAIDNNEKNNVSKDKKQNFIENDKNSIIIEIIMITNEANQKTTTYRMETINKVGIAEFISNFNTAKFKITNIQYHKQTGKIKYIEITQLY